MIRNPSEKSQLARLNRITNTETNVSSTTSEDFTEESFERNEAQFPYQRFNTSTDPTQELDQLINDEPTDSDEEDIYTIPSVQVKHSLSYEYFDSEIKANRKFEIIKGEQLFLICKKTREWWLCLRLDENLAFYVPASYLFELTRFNTSNVPPPPKSTPPLPGRETKTDNNENVKNSNSQNQNKMSFIFPDLKLDQENMDKKQDHVESKMEQPNYKHRQNAISINDNLNKNNDIDLNHQNINVSPTNLNGPSSGQKLNEKIKFFEKKKDDLKKETVKIPKENIKGSVLGLNTQNPVKDTLVDSKDLYDFNSVIDDLDDRLEKEETNSSTLCSQSNLSEPPVIKNPEQTAPEINENEPIYENIPSPFSKLNRNEVEKTCESPNLVIDENIDIVEKEVIDEENDMIDVPEGWKLGRSKCLRKFYYNHFNDEKWYINYDSNAKPYFYNSENQSVWELPKIFDDNDKEDELKKEKEHFRRDFDTDLGTFPMIHHRLSMRAIPDHIELPNPAIQESASHQEKSSKRLESNIGDGFNPSRTACDQKDGVFDCIKLFENGKKIRKKIIETYKIILKSPKLLFIKKLKEMEKLEFPVDLKGSRCYKVIGTSNSESGKDSNNNHSHAISRISKALSKKEKTTEEIFDMIGNSIYGYMVETPNGLKILLTNKEEKVINEWVASINNVILKFRSEFSPVYQSPEIIHSTSLHDTQEIIPTYQTSFQNKSIEDRLRKSFIKKETIKANSIVKNIFGSKKSDGRKLSKDLIRKINSLEEADDYGNDDHSSPAKILEHSPSIISLPTFPDQPPPLNNSSSYTDKFKKNVIKMFLSKKILKRPPIEQLKKNGIIKGWNP